MWVDTLERSSGWADDRDVSLKVGTEEYESCLLIEGGVKDDTLLGVHLNLNKLQPLLYRSRIKSKKALYVWRHTDKAEDVLSNDVSRTGSVLSGYSLHITNTDIMGTETDVL